MNSPAIQPMSRISAGKIALLITLGAESVFFATLLSGYAALRTTVGWNIPHTLDRLAIPLMNSGILALSAVAAFMSAAAIKKGNRTGLRIGLLMAVLLGLIFVAGQVYEFRHAGFQIDDEAFGGVFFTLLGFHAVHVLAGGIFLTINLVRANLGDFNQNRHEAVDIGAWFWYYVTAVWAVIFVALYLI